MTRELSRLQERSQQEENLFARVPLSRIEKKKIKHLKKSRNGYLWCFMWNQLYVQVWYSRSHVIVQYRLMGMLDDFDDDVSYLINMEEEKQRGSQHQPDQTLSQSDERLRHPKVDYHIKISYIILFYFLVFVLMNFRYLVR